MTRFQDDQDHPDLGYLLVKFEFELYPARSSLHLLRRHNFTDFFYGIKRGNKKYIRIQYRDVTLSAPIMAAVMETQLRQNKDILLQEYRSNLQDVLDLQDIFIQDILLSVTDELELCPEAVTWVTDWLCDTCTCLLFLA
jgi:hypothetical protein